ncbi:MAG: hypothetical protein Q8L41_14500 [Anaerolineales bacterium]|nr:hypothetical protein [Anaerolineales bacterium]
MWISPSFQDIDYPFPHSLDTKIILFEDRVLGWKLNIADQMINGNKEQPAINHSGYATLDVVFSYFEMFAKYEGGFAKLGKSEDYFKVGVYSVFPEFHHIPTPVTPLTPVGNVVSIVDVVLDLMYEGIRCGLYHSGITNGRIMLTGEIKTPMGFDLQNQLLIINPHLLVPRLEIHLRDYVGRLRDANNTDLRLKFEARYDFDTRA